jgi:hypothetical protein
MYCYLLRVRVIALLVSGTRDRLRLQRFSFQPYEMGTLPLQIMVWPVALLFVALQTHSCKIAL